VEIIMSSSDVQSPQEPEEDRKPTHLLDKHQELNNNAEPTAATTSVQKRKVVEKSITSMKSSKKQKE
jgi:hypothetical protein